MFTPPNFGLEIGIFWKGKEYKNINGFYIKLFGKLHIVGVNCMKIGFLVFLILQFYVFKMATNGGRHFEMPLKLKIRKLNLFLKSMHKHTQFTNVIFVYHVSNHFMG